MNRKHELYLINLGLETLLDKVSGKLKKKTGRKAWNKGKKGQKWSKERHAKFASTMSRKFGKKFNKN